jgi:hypothetical protein
MTNLILGDPLNVLIVVLAMGFLFMAGHVHGVWSTKGRT